MFEHMNSLMAAAVVVLPAAVLASAAWRRDIAAVAVAVRSSKPATGFRPAVDATYGTPQSRGSSG